MFRALILIFSLLAVSSAAAGEGGNFVSVIDDLPLMEGLEENENAAVTFETANGRIAEAEARGEVTPPAAWAFYNQVLPQLGWRAIGDGVYARENERMRVAVVSDEDGGSVVSFSVSPAE